MNVLVLVAESRMPNNDVMYVALKERVDVDVVKVDKLGQKNLKRFYKKNITKQYDRVILDLHFKRIVNQARFIRTIPQLVIIEEDACQNYIKDSKWYGKFLSFYLKIHSFRLLCSSENLASTFREEGIDACFLKKGYDQSYLVNLEIDRDIELGFIGRFSSKTYSERNKLLVDLEQEDGLVLLRTDPGAEYLDTLNRIKIFISADIGLGEYMVKNFEAMACGCLLMAYKQGKEEESMGLVDMVNIILYENKDELRYKIELLRQKPQLVDKIARNGQELAESFHSFDRLAEAITNLIKAPILHQKTSNKGLLRGFF